MLRLKALLRDTWYVWILFTAMTIALAQLVGAYFYATLPLLAVTFVYFAIVRYDAKGNDAHHGS